MRTVVLAPVPIELDELIARRRRLGIDLFDEVWEGEYHLVPAPQSMHGRIDQQLAVLLDPLARAAGLSVTGPFNLGEQGNFRVPDRGVHRTPPDEVWVPTAAIVIEIVSPGDETWDKLPFYAAHEVDELLIVDSTSRAVHWLALDTGTYQPVERSRLVDASPAELAAQLQRPS